MVTIEFYPESSNVIIKPQKYSYHHTEDPLLKILLKHKQDFSTITVADPVSLEYLIKENIESKSVILPKRETLGEEFNDEDYEKLCTKLTLQHEQFKNRQVRDIFGKVERLKMTFSRLTTEEIFTALKNFEYNEDEVMMLLTKNEFIGQLRNEIAQYRHRNPIVLNSVTPVVVTTPSLIKENKSFNEIEELHSYDSHSDSSDAESETASITTKSSYKRKSKSSTSVSGKKASRLRLDDALANATDMEGWSEARIRAYQSMKKNPNTYFYRFNAPGETQKNGPWSKEEDDLFMRRLAEFGADGQWGIFSMSIPGRVGYQCSNYYRKLIEIGRIKDSNYRLDEKGKAHYVGGKTRAREVEIEESEAENDSESESQTESELESEAKFTSSTITTNSFSFNKSNFENPLPNFIDSITQTEVIRPAISPYGHVLSYDTWLKCLLNGDRKNTCPLTNQPLHKRQLIFLTHENIEMYRDKIRKE